MAKPPWKKSIVSLSSPDITIALLPGRAVLRMGGRLLEQGSGEGWEGALAALNLLLVQAQPNGTAHIILSHHFSGVMLLPPPPVRLSNAEMDGWVAGCLTESYGAEAAAWRPIWQDVPPGRAVPVAVMEGARFDRLALRMKESGLTLGLVEPWFCSAWDRQRRALANRSGWLALLEPGRICLSRIEKGRPVILRVAQAGDTPMADLAAMVARESLHASVTIQGDIWLAAAGVEVPSTGSVAGCILHALLPAGANGSSLLP